jgi:hypothetical protein
LRALAGERPKRQGKVAAAQTADMTVEHDDHEHHPHRDDEDRTTAPQSEYTTRDVAFGVVIATVGLSLTFGIPLLLA